MSQFWEKLFTNGQTNQGLNNQTNGQTDEWTNTVKTTGSIQWNWQVQKATFNGIAFSFFNWHSVAPPPT